METPKSGAHDVYFGAVYRLPMRDGNETNPQPVSVTYTVYRLPMRDGNTDMCVAEPERITCL